MSLILVKKEEINNEISAEHRIDFDLAADGLYLIEIIASAKSWWQNLKNLKFFFNDDDLAVMIDDKDIAKEDNNKEKTAAGWNGNELKGLFKTLVIAIRLNKGKHSILLAPHRSPYVKYARISKVEDADAITYIPEDNNPAEDGDRRPWFAFVLIDLPISAIRISASAGKRGWDDDDIKLMINGETVLNEDDKAHKYWYWCGKILQGKEKNWQKAIDPPTRTHVVELRADRMPMLKKFEAILKSDPSGKNNDYGSKELRKYTYRGPDGKSDYNRYDNEISKVVDYWNYEFLNDDYPVTEPLDPNLVKAIVYQESKMGYAEGGGINIMQVGNPGDPSLRTLNGELAECWIKGGKQIKLDYGGKAMVETQYDSIFWGVRWLYHKAQGITGDGKRYWNSWRTAVDSYGPPETEYGENVWSIYINGQDKQISGITIKLWLLALLILAPGFFAFFKGDYLNANQSITEQIKREITDSRPGRSAYIRDIVLTKNSFDASTFFVLEVWEKDWWEYPHVFKVIDGAVRNIEFDQLPTEQSIMSAKFLKLNGFANPVLEIYGETHVGNGRIYLYELASDSLILLASQVAVDYYEDNIYHPDNRSTYGYAECSEIYAGKKLESSYRDIDEDGIDDLVLTGERQKWCENYPDDPVLVSRTPVVEEHILIN